jgi:hypothetical protein
MLVLAAVSMLASSVAWAQSAPAPAGDQTAPMPGMHRPMNDPVAWHKERCVNHYAGLAGKLAFLEAKLDLTDAQRPAWSAWRQARIDDAVKERDSCLADVPPQPHGPPTILEGEARMEKMLSARLAGLQARRPALEALYAALTPEQKAILDRMGGRHGHHHDADLHHDGQDHDGDGH